MNFQIPKGGIVKTPQQGKAWSHGTIDKQRHGKKYAREYAFVQMRSHHQR